MSENLTNAQNDLLIFLLERLPVREEATIVSAPLEVGGTKRVAAFSELSGDESVHVVFTLPATGNQSFLTFTDGDPREIANLLSNLEEAEANEVALGLGSYVLMQSAYLERHGRVGVLLLTPTTVAHCNVPAEAVVEGRKLRFALATFLTDEEYQYKNVHGHDALMDRFQTVKRDLVSISSEAA